MKKAITMFLFSLLFIFINSCCLYASATIDKSNSANGTITIKYTGDTSKNIKASVEKNGEKYIYSIKRASVNLPLQMGKGSYKVSVLEGVGGNKYKPLVTESFDVPKIEENKIFLASIPIVYYTSDMKSIQAYKKANEGKAKEFDKFFSVYSDIVKEYAYDFDKAKSVASDYVPVIDEMYTKKMGICYDYAALLAGVLRSQGIPSKLVMGYSPEISEYHAWNEILINNKWVVVDTTYDAQMEKAKAKYSYDKDGSKFKVVKVY